jgi:GT2 family glycosyltransferase
VNSQSTLSLSLAVVCYHNSPDELAQLIDSVSIAIGSLKQKYSLEPIVFYLIDNAESVGPEAGFLESLEQLDATVGLSFRLIQGHGNLGYGRAHNLALSGLNSDYHLMLNPDVLLNPDALTIGIDYLQEHSATVLSAPMAIGPDGSRQYLCKRYPSLFTLFVRGFLPQALRRPFAARLARYEMQDLSDTEPTASVPIASGCYMLCRTKQLAAVGGFNENYFLYFEDFDLSLRMGQVGQIAYLPAMKIVHGGGNAAKKGLRHIAYFTRSALRFFNRHGWRWFS